MSEETKQLVKKLLTKDPTHRIEWMELLKVNINNEGRIVTNNRALFSLLSEENSSLFDTAKLSQSSKFTPIKEAKE